MRSEMKAVVTGLPIVMAESSEMVSTAVLNRSSSDSQELNTRVSYISDTCDFSLKHKYSAKMNASSWRKAADFITKGTQATQKIQAAATADSNQLESLLLSALAASTPRATTTPVREIQPTDPYHQIIPGMSEHLYATLTADSSLSTPASDDCSTLHKQITSELDKYLQEATEKCEAELL